MIIFLIALILTPLEQEIIDLEKQRQIHVEAIQNIDIAIMRRKVVTGETKEQGHRQEAR